MTTVGSEEVFKRLALKAVARPCAVFVQKGLRQFLWKPEWILRKTNHSNKPNLCICSDLLFGNVIFSSGNIPAMM